jgi:RNA polymerase sigma factor (sigma-70 family)
MGLPDSTLLDRFAAHRDESAFRMLVDRHLDHVHSVARRVTGSEDLARDVAQSTFLRLAERAALIPRQLPLAAWLHQTSRSFAVNLVRAEERRKNREQRAMNDLTMNAPPEAVWSQLAPVIDELVERLPSAYRDIILHRFYHDQSHAAVAAKLGLTEEAARKRSARALEKLRALLGRRGITTTTVALASLLPVHAAEPAPAALAGVVAAAAKGVVPLAKGGLISTVATATAGQKAALAGMAVALLATGAVLPQWLGDAPAEEGVTMVAGGSNDTAERGVKPRRERAVHVALETPEARYGRLREILSVGDPAGRRKDLLAFLDDLAPGDFEETAGNFQRLWSEAAIAAGTDLRAEFSLMLLNWARLDLPASLGFVEGRAPGFCEEVAAYWGSTDPEAALAWAREKSAAATGVNLRLAGVLEGIARTDLARAISLAAEFPAEQGELLRRVLYAQYGRDREAPAKMLALLDDEGLRQAVIGAAANFRAGADPGGSLHLLMDHPEAVAEANPLSIYNVWVGQDLGAATGSLASLPPGEFLKSALSVVSRETAVRNPAAAVELIQRYPAGVDDALLKTLAEVSLAAAPEVAMEQIIPQMGDEDARNSAYVSGLARWGEMDAGAARSWRAGHPLPAEVNRKLSQR